MNEILQLKGQFEHGKNNSFFGNRNLPVGKTVTSEHIFRLKEQLERINNFWIKDTTIGGALFSVYYIDVIAKSNRVSSLFTSGKVSSNDTIRGARFDGVPQRHVFVHFVSMNVVQAAISKLDFAAKIVAGNYKGVISYSDIEMIHNKKESFKEQELTVSAFINTVVDSYFVEHFDVDEKIEDVSDASIISLYKTNANIKELLTNLGITMADAKMIDDTTLRVSPDEFSLLKGRVPYLISMKTIDLADISKDDIESRYSKEINITIPDPTNEPVVGVIDTLFDNKVYFSKWVDYTCYINKNISIVSEDYEHGTAVSSIIVDGPSLNPGLDDGCGRFRVKHFGVATHGKFSSFSILRDIREIVKSNPDIKVWNLSLGSSMEINNNFISPEAAELDKIQSEYDVLFVVSGTNKSNDRTSPMKIGAPADSLNSLIINSVDINKHPASYHRVGPVLSFFNKPDVSYYGGDKTQSVTVYTPSGTGCVGGTSFAAPWITRKVAFLMCIMGFSREVAKALIIDSAAGWDRCDDTSHSIGYGVVPIRIEDIVNTSDDEIRFIMTGSADSFETYTYRIPVPFVNDTHPFFARATLCYFPECSRNQGVDYTNTEMDIHFGRVYTKNDKPQIKSLDNNKQNDDGFIKLYEGNARTFYRKWDNIKHISDTISSRSRPRKKYDAGLWGLSIKTKERLTTKHDRSMPFGVVITLKEMNGKNRIDEFIKSCQLRGWIVNRIDVQNYINVYKRAEDIVDFD